MEREHVWQQNLGTAIHDIAKQDGKPVEAYERVRRDLASMMGFINRNPVLKDAISNAVACIYGGQPEGYHGQTVLTPTGKIIYGVHLALADKECMKPSKGADPDELAVHFVFLQWVQASPIHARVLGRMLELSVEHKRRAIGRMDRQRVRLATQER